MPSLKEYRNRIASVKSTRKITSAMKMVAASKLRRAQESAQAAQPYARALNGILRRVASGVPMSPTLPKLLVGTGADQVQLLVVVSADRGLCGGFNGNIVRFARAYIRSTLEQGKTLKIVTVGRKARDLLRRDHPSLIVKSFMDFGKATKGVISYDDANSVAQYLLTEFDAGAFDTCTLLYNEFRNILSQKPATSQLIPFRIAENSNDNKPLVPVAPYEFEPCEEELLSALLPKNLSTQIFGALLDSAAGEQAARMTAMDNATRNAGDMIKKLSLSYNRARQAFITKELIEIISGAEAV